MSPTHRLSTPLLIGRDEIAPGYQVLRFGESEELLARPGQFVMVRSCSWGAAPLLPRPMSLLEAGNEPAILIKVVGEATKKMACAPLGERFSFLAPLGRPWKMPPPGYAPLLVAGGVGVAPLVFLAAHLSNERHKDHGARASIVTLYGGRSAADLPLCETLTDYGRLEVATEDGSRGTKGRVTILLQRLLNKRQEGDPPLQIYTCGPQAMMAAVSRLAETYGVACEASLEAPMACGFGVCLGCAVTKKDKSYLYTCIDGPCVDARQIDWHQPVF